MHRLSTKAHITGKLAVIWIINSLEHRLLAVYNAI